MLVNVADSPVGVAVTRTGTGARANELLYPPEGPRANAPLGRGPRRGEGAHDPGSSEPTR